MKAFVSKTAPKLFFTLSLLVLTSIASARTPLKPELKPTTVDQEMSCLLSVYRAEDMKDDADTLKSVQKVVLKLEDGGADQEFQINGETVAVTLSKKEFTDLYSVVAVLTTPVADRPARGPNWVAIVSDYLYNDGPTKNNGWDLDPGPTAVRYAYLNYQSGMFAFSTKLVAALKAEGKWGKYPFSESRMDTAGSQELTEFVQEQMKQGKMKPTDVVGLSTVFSCTLDNVGATKFPR